MVAVYAPPKSVVYGRVRDGIRSDSGRY
jgi:hypothetical protein